MTTWLVTPQRTPDSILYVENTWDMQLAMVFKQGMVDCVICVTWKFHALYISHGDIFKLKLPKNLWTLKKNPSDVLQTHQTMFFLQKSKKTLSVVNQSWLNYGQPAHRLTREPCWARKGDRAEFDGELKKKLKEPDRIICICWNFSDFFTLKRNFKISKGKTI